MHFIYVYSSRSGNTRKLAQTVHERLHPDSPIYDLADELPEGLSDQAAVFVLFYWNDRGIADQAMQAFMRRLSGKPVMALGTLGAYDNGPAADKMKQQARQVQETNGNQLLAEFCCRGKIAVAQTLRRIQKPGGGLDQAGLIRHLSSHDHPNEADFERAIKAVQGGCQLLATLQV